MEQILTTNGYTADDMTITSCPSAEQVSILLSSASILAAEGVVNFSAAAAARKISTSSNDATTPTPATATQRKFSFEKRVSFENTQTQQMENVPEVPESGSSAASPAAATPTPPPATTDADEMFENQLQKEEQTTTAA